MTILLPIGQSQLAAAAETLRTRSGWDLQIGVSLHDLLHRDVQHAPQLVVLPLESVADCPVDLLEHAKHHWPYTFFLLVSSQAPGTFSPIFQQYGEMPVISGDAACLASAIDREMNHLSYGALHGVGLASLLQMLEWEGKMLCVHVKTDEQWGRLHITRGQLVSAYVHDPTLHGNAAALHILRWHAPTVTLERSYHNHQSNVTCSLTNLLMEAMRLNDEAVSAPTPPPAPVATLSQKEKFMSTVNETLTSALKSIDGAMAAALVDHQSGMALGMVGSGVDLELAAAGNTEVVRAKLRTMASLGIEGTIEDILITLDRQYHIIYLVPNMPLFLYLVLDKDKANLAMSRYKLKSLGATLLV